MESILQKCLGDVISFGKDFFKRKKLNKGRSAPQDILKMQEKP